MTGPDHYRKAEELAEKANEYTDPPGTSVAVITPALPPGHHTSRDQAASPLDPHS